MDLSQNKLSKSEWNNIEIPISNQELYICDLIKKGYNNININKNLNISLCNYLKVEKSASISMLIYNKYIKNKLDIIIKKYSSLIPQDFKSEIKNEKNIIKKKDLIRFANAEKYNQIQDTYEYSVLKFTERLFHYQQKNELEKWLYYFYSIKIIMTYNISNKNMLLEEKISNLLMNIDDSKYIYDILINSQYIIEKNENIIKFRDDKLFDHQKSLFSHCKKPNPKLILYIAPTGTGKTMSPLGLAEQHKIIFVCAARHVGLALAKYAISNQKKVGFAFGCNSAEDIRLHYYSAKEYTKNKKTGGIFKVDNSVGDLVEILISDIQSYIYAMYYMLAFNAKENLILYWDEPTISLDYDSHPLHPVIKNNWSKNLIPNIVLSSATLPLEDQIAPTILDFKSKFSKAEVFTITSYDFTKSISILNKEGCLITPHNIAKNYKDLKDIVKHCESCSTILRYIDLSECIKFIKSVQNCNSLKKYNFTLYFESILQITMINIKKYYILLLNKISEEDWNSLSFPLNNYMSEPIQIVTKHAYTLTDGPTIYIAKDIQKISQFCIQQSNIPKSIMENILKTISQNNRISDKISVLQKNFEDATKKDENNEKKMENCRFNPEIKKLLTQISDLQSSMSKVHFNEKYIPNSVDHLLYWGIKDYKYGKPFCCEIDEGTVEKIMLIDDVNDSWKLLLIMGIGVFTTHSSIKYTEIMKLLAQQQKLFLILATSDFIYGTNYQFCHGYIGKDIADMSQEKCIQAFGRIGRSKMQYTYTIRLRDNILIDKIFKKEENKPEIYNMEKLFTSD